MKEEISIETCLNKIPNKFKLALVAMTRAKEILLGSKTEIEESRFNKKAVKKALREIENDKIDINDIEEKIGKDLLKDANFLKETKLHDDLQDDIGDLDLKEEDFSDDEEDFEENEDLEENNLEDIEEFDDEEIEE